MAKINPTVSYVDEVCRHRWHKIIDARLSIFEEVFTCAWCKRIMSFEDTLSLEGSCRRFFDNLEDYLKKRGKGSDG